MWKRHADGYAGKLGFALEDGQRRVGAAPILDDLHVYLGQLPEQLSGEMSRRADSCSGKQNRLRLTPRVIDEFVQIGRPGSRMCH
jgi:hypothetical protein